jgi:hypothetical protein
MEIQFRRLKPTIKLADDSRYPDLLAYASITLVDEHERHLTINGFTIRKSKYDGKPYLMPPSRSTGKSFYKFILTERSLWKEIEKEVIKEYEVGTIPIVEEKR